MNSHRQYMSLGVVLAEYMTKSCLAYLPTSQQHLCDRMLHGVGIDLQTVGLGTVGQTVMAVALTGAPLQAPARPAPTTQAIIIATASDGVLGAVWEAMGEVQTISAMPCPLPSAMHARFLVALRAHQSLSEQLDVVQAASVEAYGQQWSVWTKGGLTHRLLLHDEHPPPLLQSDVECAYAQWHALAERAAALMPPDSVHRWRASAI
jgi:hypothetical protein